MSDLLSTTHRHPIAHLPYSTRRQFTVKASELRRWSGAELDEEVELRVRAMAGGDGRVWLVAKDVCALIGKRVGSVGRAIHTLSEGEKGRMVVQHKAGGQGRGEGRGQGKEAAVQVMSVLSVEGVQRLLGRSRCSRAGRLLTALLDDIRRLSHPPTLTPSSSPASSSSSSPPPSPVLERRERGRKRARGPERDELGSGVGGREAEEMPMPLQPSASPQCGEAPLSFKQLHWQSRLSAFRRPAPLASPTRGSAPTSSAVSRRPVLHFCPVILHSQR